MEGNSNVNETKATTTVDNTVEQSTTTSTTTTETVDKATKTTEKKETPVVPLTPKEDKIKLTHLDEDFVYDLMKVPTYSGYEFRLLTFIVMWARRNNIDFQFDEYGNLYLTKGTVGEGEYYPCVTAHLDSVQTKHKTYAQAGKDLDVKTRVVGGKHEIFVNGMGIGGDDKAGVLIGLSMFNHVEKLKACFFLEEETGCKGSSELDEDWFKDVGYVIGYDSPDLNRAAWACSGVKLFSAKFFQDHMEEICKKHGLTDFRSEPFTDVKVIREKTNIMCMNFGSGYYNAHGSTEYCVIEDMDTACRMGHELIEHLGLERFELENKSIWGGGTYKNGVYVKNNVDDDAAFFNKRDKSLTYAYDDYGYGGSHTRTYPASSTTKTNTTTATKTTTTPKQEAQTDVVSMETVKYLSERYEEYIENIKTKVFEKCKELGVESSEFESIFNNKITF